MTFTSPEDIRKKVERLWKSGQILRALVGSESPFPLRIGLRLPSTRDISLDFGGAQEWVVALRTLTGTRLESRPVRSQALGQQQIPLAIWIDRAEDALLLLETQDDAERFRALHAATLASVPEVLPWVETNPFRLLAIESDWPKLLQVLTWMRERSAQRIYIRQIDLPGIDTKFVESHISILPELFDAVMDESTGERRIDAADFHTRFGFLREPTRIRFRILDSTIKFADLPNLPDVELDADSFAALRLPLQRVFVTENKTNFLSFPEFEKSIVVFGAGYGMAAFGSASWIHGLPLYYWGDIDTHGFAILNQLRSVFPHAQSFLMDRETLFDHQGSWTMELTPFKRPLDLLTHQEMVLFSELQAGIPRPRIRLEQEKVMFSRLRLVLERLTAEESGTASPISPTIR
jgi:hypothetical protein